MDKKIRVAITHGDTNGIGYEIILKAFEDSGMLEMCTPIIYGNPKIATYHRNALQLETPFSIISKAEDAHPDKLNMLATFDEEVKVEFGSPTPESAEAAVGRSCPQGLATCQGGLEKRSLRRSRPGACGTQSHP